MEKSDCRRRACTVPEMQHAIGKRLARASQKIGVTSWYAVQETCLYNKKRKTSGLTHGDDFVVTGTKGSLLELKKQLESVYPSKASIIGPGSTKSIKALNRRRCWGYTGTLYQHDSRHVDVLFESLGVQEWKHSADSNN